MEELKPNFCKAHNKQFDSYNSYKQHMNRKHNGLKEKGEFQCLKCKKLYKSKDCLRKHVCKKPAIGATSDNPKLQQLCNVLEEVQKETGQDFFQPKRLKNAITSENHADNNEVSCLSVGDYLKKSEELQTSEESHAIIKISENATHSAQVQEIVAENKRLKEENLGLWKQVEDLGLLLDRKTIDCEHLSQQIQLFRQQTQDLEREAQNYKKQQKNYQLEYQKAEAQIKKKLGEEVKVLENQIISLEKERNQLQTSIEELNLKLSKNDKELYDYQQRCSSSEGKYTALEKRAKDFCMDQLPNALSLASSYYERLFPKETCPNYDDICKKNYPKQYAEYQKRWSK